MFKSVMKLYESKQYKKAIKQADAILKRFPQHGETLAMKGLTINSMHPATKKDAAIDFVRKGIQNDMRYVQTYIHTCTTNELLGDVCRRMESSCSSMAYTTDHHFFLLSTIYIYIVPPSVGTSLV